MVAGRSDAERALALHVVAADRRAEAEDERVAFLQVIVAGYRVRKGRAFAERHQSAERRLDFDADHGGQFLRHLVGDGVGRGLEDLVFGDAAVGLDVGAAGCTV